MKGNLWDITSLPQLEMAAKEVLEYLKTLQSQDCASTLALTGDLGAGKTTFTQTLAKLLGVSESLTSPTFVIMKKYLTTDQCFKTLVHIDAYRLSSPEELRVLGLADELKDKGSLVVVEWAEKVDTLLPPEAMKLEFILDGTRRTLKAV